MARSYRCGECKQLGHNKQTCHKNRSPKKIHQPPVRTGFQSSEEYRETFFRQFDEPYENYSRKRQQPNVTSMTGEELTVWWTLTHDEKKLGDGGVYVARKVEQRANEIACFISAIPSPTRATVTGEAWRQFFAHQPLIVLEKLASEENMPAELWDVLASDTRGIIRQRIVSNPVAPQKVLSKIYNDVTAEHDKLERTRALDRESLAYHNQTVRYEDLLSSYGLNRRSPPHILTELTQHPSAWVRANIAENFSLSAEDYDVLSRDSATAVRLAVLRNAACPIEYVEKIYRNDKDPRVLREARKRLEVRT